MSRRLSAADALPTEQTGLGTLDLRQVRRPSSFGLADKRRVVGLVLVDVGDDIARGRCGWQSSSMLGAELLHATRRRGVQVHRRCRNPAPNDARSRDNGAVVAGDRNEVIGPDVLPLGRLSRARIAVG